MIRSCLIVALSAVALAATADVPTVENPAQAPVDEVWNLVERWRVGADEDDVLLGKIIGLASGPDGELYALDTQLAQVLVFGPDGEHRRTLGREGSGPGEFRQPIAMFLTPDGRLAVQQAFPGQLIYIDAQDGTPRGSWTLGGESGDDAGGFAFLSLTGQRGGTFAAAGAFNAFDLENKEIRATEFLELMDLDGASPTRLVEKSSNRSLTAFTIDELAAYNPADRGKWDLTPDGKICVAPRHDAYQIDVHDRQGRLVRRITRDHEARLRTEEEKEDVRNSMNIDINGMQPRISWKLQDRAECVDWVRVLDDGTIWVRDSRGRDGWQDEGRMSFGVFGPEGDLHRQVTLQLPEPGEGNRLLLLDDGRVAMIKGLDRLSLSVTVGNDDEVQPSDEPLSEVLLEIICYDIER